MIANHVAPNAPLTTLAGDREISNAWGVSTREVACFVAAPATAADLALASSAVLALANANAATMRGGRLSAQGKVWIIPTGYESIPPTRFGFKVAATYTHTDEE